MFAFTVPSPGTLELQCSVPVAPRRLCPAAVPERARGRFIKRVVGVPGDRIRLRHGRFIRNGTADSTRIRRCAAGTPFCTYRGSIRVPPHSFYVAGDNRGESDDSRYWGAVVRANIIGRVR